MQKEAIRETKIDKFTQVLIDSGEFVVDVSSPLGACKRALEQVEQRNEDRFIENVLNDVNAADIESLDAVKSLKRLYRVIQVINKAITQDKINRFKTLTVNGIINQDKIDDSQFELFVNIIDELTDIEFVILDEINKLEIASKNDKFILNQDMLVEAMAKTLNISINQLESFMYRLKAKGMITGAYGFDYAQNALLYKGVIDGKLSNMAKELLDFINMRGVYIE